MRANNRFALAIRVRRLNTATRIPDKNAGSRAKTACTFLYASSIIPRFFGKCTTFLNDVCPYGQMMYPAGMMLPSAMMCPAGHERQTSHHCGTKCRSIISERSDETSSAAVGGDIIDVSLKMQYNNL